MRFLQPFFSADATLVLLIALMVTASFHFFKARLRPKKEKGLLEWYISFCEAFDNLVHFISILTVIAFGYSFGWMEMVKLLILCLVLPIIGNLIAMIIGVRRWEVLAGIIAMPLALYCAWRVFPHLNWFGFL
ncbi:MAG: hypothetical protein J0M34_07325 [Alphaproteobacteria bacterium]|nr:hypothetical protein [Alphaproteobacteria bacterium]